MMLSKIFIPLIKILACLEVIAALNTDISTEKVIPADLQSDIAALYGDAYLKEWIAYSNAYQRLFKQYSDYYSTHCCTVKRKQNDDTIYRSLTFSSSIPQDYLPIIPQNAQ